MLRPYAVDNCNVWLHHSGKLDHLPGPRDSHFKWRKALPWGGQKESLGHPALKLAFSTASGSIPNAAVIARWVVVLPYVPVTTMTQVLRITSRRYHLVTSRRTGQLRSRHSFQSSIRPNGVRRSWGVSRYDRMLITAPLPHFLDFLIGPWGGLQRWLCDNKVVSILVRSIWIAFTIVLIKWQVP